MAERRTLLWAFRQVTRDHLRDSFEWLLYTLIFSLLPVWGGASLYRVVGMQATWLDFTRNGEFALYTAALIGPVIHIMVFEREQYPFPSRGFLILLSASLLAGSVLIFSGVTVLQRIIDLGGYMGEIREDAVAGWSLAIFVLGVVTALVVNLLDTLRRTPNVPEIVAENQKSFERKFEELK